LDRLLFWFVEKDSARIIFFRFILDQYQQRRSYPMRVEQMLRTPEEKAARQREAS